MYLRALACADIACMLFVMCFCATFIYETSTDSLLPRSYWPIWLVVWKNFAHVNRTCFQVQSTPAADTHQLICLHRKSCCCGIDSGTIHLHLLPDLLPLVEQSQQGQDGHWPVCCSAFGLLHTLWNV